MTLFHDSGFGIYTCFNGPAGESAFIGNQLIHYYVSDLMLGEKPWLNESTARSFPEPWGRKSTFFIPRAQYTPFKKHLHSSRPITEYCGQYFHDFMGKIVINIDIESSVLIMSYGKGRFLLYPNGNCDEFQLEGVGLMNFVHELDLYSPSEWMMVKFHLSANNENVEGLVCSLFESGPLFIKRV